MSPHTPTHTSIDPNATTGDAPDVPPGPPPATGDRYRLGDEIARGGMGAVFRATDTALGREVAVKVLQDRFAPTSGVARRFADEARITGQLQHPNIPPVYDVGVLPDGRPLLAMKLIKGETLDDLLKARRDPAADRGHFLGVFEKVCEAVAYAHAHGVIHRDLKPANVMVGAFGEVQVMDWGLAKVLTTLSREAQPSDPDATAAATAIVSQRESDDLQTQAGSILGTPAYMAPEQAIGAVDQLDRRTDVFGLGGILACVLTGQPPFVGPTAESTRQQAAARKLGDCFARLDGCGAEPELVALCKRCLAGEQDDRPADAKRVAEEVAALRAAADDRARRAELEAAEGQVRLAEGRKRRRVAMTAVGLVLAAVTVGGIAAGVQWRRAEAALEAKTTEEQAKGQALAEAVRNLADRDAARKQELVALRRLADEFVVDQLGRRPELTPTSRRFLTEVLGLWQAVADTRGTSPEVRELRAEGALRVGMVRHKLGDSAQAEAAYRAARDAYQQLAADAPDRPEHRDGLAHAHTNLGMLLTAAGRPADAEAAFRAALAVHESLAAERPARPEQRQESARTRVNLGILLTAAGRPADAEAAFRAARAGYTKLVTDFPTRPDYRGGLAATNYNLGMLLQTTGRAAEAETAYRAARAAYDALAADHPAVPDYRVGAANSHAGLGILLAGTGRAAEAEVADRAAQAVWAALAAEFPAVPEYKVRLGGACCNLGNVLAGTGRPGESLDWYARAIATLDPVHAADPRQVTPKQFLRNSHHSRAAALDRLGRPADALADWDRAIELSAPNEQPGYRARRASSLSQAGQTSRAIAEVAALAARPQGWRSEQLYGFACVYSVASSKVPAKHTEYAGRATDLLRKAVAGGFKDAAHMWQDSDLDPLRSRPDFRQLLADLGAAREPAPKPRHGR